MADEETIFDGRVPTRAFHFSHGLLWLLLLGWNFGLIGSWLRSLSCKLKITSHRVVVIRGLISQTEEQVEFYRVKDSQFEQSAIQRIFGVGRVTLMSDDATAPELTFLVPRPKYFREQIGNFVRTQRKHMRAFQTD